MALFAIAGLQLELAAQDNLELIGEEIRLTVTRFPWVRMIVLPELATFGPDTANATELPGPVEDRYREIAAEHSIWLVAGSLFERAGNAVYNTASVLDPRGEVVARHRKIYPFLPYERGVAAGNRVTTFDVPGVGRFGLSICYDMWFPETTRQMVADGAEVIVHPTMTNTIDRDVEIAMVRAAAIQNQVYFIDINNAGRLGYGRSVIADPCGRVLHEASRGFEVIPVEIDLAEVRRCRERGSMGLCQPLKSFRDNPVEFPVYNGGEGRFGALGRLGPLAMPRRDDEQQ